MNTLASARARIAGKRERELAWWALLSRESDGERRPRKAVTLPTDVPR